MEIGESSPVEVGRAACDPAALSSLATELEGLGYPVGALLADCLEALASGSGQLARHFELINACLEAWIGQFGRAESPKSPRSEAWMRVHSNRQFALVKLLRLQAGLQQLSADQSASTR